MSNIKIENNNINRCNIDIGEETFLVRSIKINNNYALSYGKSTSLDQFNISNLSGVSLDLGTGIILIRSMNSSTFGEHLLTSKYLCDYIEYSWSGQQSSEKGYTIIDIALGYDPTVYSVSESSVGVTVKIYSSKIEFFVWAKDEGTILNKYTTINKEWTNITSLQVRILPKYAINSNGMHYLVFDIDAKINYGDIWENIYTFNINDTSLNNFNFTNMLSYTAINSLDSHISVSELRVKPRICSQYPSLY